MDTSVDLKTVLPLPEGLELGRSPEGTQLQLVLSPFFASKLRRVFGYIAEISLTSGEGTETPAQLQVVTRIPWRYGRTTAEKESSWMLARLQAFVSKSLFGQAARVLKLGDCICGFTEPSSGNAKSCQVVGWDVCSVEQWRLATPASVPTNFDLADNRAPPPCSSLLTVTVVLFLGVNMDSVFVVPQLSATNFSYTRLPHVSHGVFCSGPIGGTFAVPSHPSDGVIAHLRSQHLAQALLYGGAPGAVAHIPPPPGRGRSAARGVSRVRAAPVNPPAPARLDAFVSGPPPVFPRHFLSDTSLSPGGCRCPSVVS